MRTTIREARNLAGRFRGGKLAPVMAVAMKGGEGGLLTQTATVELDPVAGRLITPITLELHAVYVPVQAMVALRDSSDPHAGITEVIRQRYLDGSAIFGLVDEDEVTKRMGVMPVSIGGVKKVSEAAKLAHICAVNFLRQSLYTYAAILPASHVGVTPALLSSTALDLFNGVLNPDDHVNGMVELEISGSLSVPIRKRGTDSGATAQRNAVIDVLAPSGATQTHRVDNDTAGPTAGIAFTLQADGGPMPLDTSMLQAGGFSLTDLKNAETMDRLTRQMRSVIDANPVDGEEQVVRWAHGLRIDDAYVPFLLARRSTIFGQDMLKAMDGVGIESEVTQSRFMQRLSITVPVPTTELGGVVVTFLVVKPDEVLKQQPHPVLSQPWAFDNLVEQELMLDPVPVTGRDIQADVPQANEATVCFYTGFNELRRSYVNYGWARNVDPATVDAKNQLWQYEIPASVTPENIVYPADIDHFPFIDQDAEIARYMVASTYVGKSPIFVGPSPVETVSVIDSEDLFGDFDGADA